MIDVSKNIIKFKSYFRGSPDTPMTVEMKKCSAIKDHNIKQVSSAPNLDWFQDQLQAKLEQEEVRTEDKEEETQVPKLRYVKSDVGRKRKLSSAI